MKYIMVLFSFTFISLSSLLHADTFFIAVGSCPPWKHGNDDEATQKMLLSCKNDIEVVTNSFSEKFDINQDQIYVLEQKDAIYDKISSTMQKIGKKAKPNDLLIVYLNSHGGIIPHKYKGYSVTSEIFALYTEEEPSDYSKAINENVWLSVREFRDMITGTMEQVKMNALVIIEACHSESSSEPFKFSPFITLKSSQKLAAIFSARSDQSASFTDDQTYARFTKEFSDSINNLKKGESLFDAYSKASEETYMGQLNKCLSLPDESLEYVYSNSEVFYESCVQQPDFFDPKGLIASIKVK